MRVAVCIKIDDSTFSAIVRPLENAQGFAVLTRNEFGKEKHVAEVETLESGLCLLCKHGLIHNNSKPITLSFK